MTQFFLEGNEITEGNAEPTVENLCQLRADAKTKEEREQLTEEIINIQKTFKQCFIDWESLG